MTFRERLREEIEYKGLQVKEISAAAGINNNTFLSYIDSRGYLPNVETAVRIANVLGVSVEYLVTGKKESESQYYTHYSPEIRKLADKLAKMSSRDRSYVTALINAINEE